tara:strand:- start:122 stop:550 length:429 start_codon:yes stop_codon:yes gene_type:complete
MDTLKSPFWFRALIIIILLLWNLMGILNFFFQLNITKADVLLLPESQKIFHTETTCISIISFAMGVFGGFIGCFALLTKRKTALKFFWISFIGILLHMNHNLTLSKGGEMESQILLMSSILIALTLASIFLTKKAIAKNWVV